MANLDDVPQYFVVKWESTPPPPAEGYAQDEPKTFYVICQGVAAIDPAALAEGFGHAVGAELERNLHVREFPAAPLPSPNAIGGMQMMQSTVQIQSVRDWARYVSTRESDSSIPPDS